MLTTAEITSMRSTAESNLREVCTIQSGSSVSDGGGGFAVTPYTAGSCMSSLDSMGSNQEREVASRMGLVSPVVVVVPVSAAITASNKLVIGGHTYEVNALLIRSVETTRRLLCTEIA